MIRKLIYQVTCVLGLLTIGTPPAHATVVGVFFDSAGTTFDALIAPGAFSF